MPSPARNLVRNLEDVRRLLAIHTDIGGEGQGRRHGVEVLNKSGVVFIVAAWEAFIEDVAIQATDHLLRHATDPSTLPLPIRKAVAKSLSADKDELAVWKLAGEGWKTIAVSYRDNVIRKEVDTFNTPKPDKIDSLYQKLLDIRHLSNTWYWKGISAANASRKLREFVELRGAIAHRGQLTESVKRVLVEDRRMFILRLAAKTSNVVRTSVRTQSGKYPWPRIRI